MTFNPLRILCLLKLHDWSGSAWNPWMVEHEQRCTICGAYRHREINLYSDHLPWVDGQHPNAIALREQDKERNY